jgi:hypothetical protein
MALWLGVLMPKEIALDFFESQRKMDGLFGRPFPAMLGWNALMRHNTIYVGSTYFIVYCPWDRDSIGYSLY